MIPPKTKPPTKMPALFGLPSSLFAQKQVSSTGNFVCVHVCDVCACKYTNMIHNNYITESGNSTLNIILQLHTMTSKHWHHKEMANVIPICSFNCEGAFRGRKLHFPLMIWTERQVDTAVTPKTLVQWLQNRS